MSSKETQAFLKRFRQFCHNTFLFSGNPSVGNYSGNLFCERAFKDSSAKLEQRDFLPETVGDVPNVADGTLEIGWHAFHYGRVPFSRYYLVTNIIQGSTETQEVTFHIYEYRFSGVFALWRQPLWRKREITIPIDAIKGSRQNLRKVWEPGVDKDWSNGDVIGRAPIERLEHYGRHLYF